jgi:hypothetical protein
MSRHEKAKDVEFLFSGLVKEGEKEKVCEIIKKLFVCGSTGKQH